MRYTHQSSIIDFAGEESVEVSAGTKLERDVNTLLYSLAEFPVRFSILRLKKSKISPLLTSFISTI